MAQTATPAKTDISLNQTGYLPNAVKMATIAQAGKATLDWKLIDTASGKAVATGMTSEGTEDLASGDTVHRIDFSSFTKPGSYQLTVGNLSSNHFRIAADLYKPLARDALAYFYQSRSGIEIKAEYVGTKAARRAGHLSDSETKVYKSEVDYTINGLGGWYDAGDYGKYVVNGGITAWTLQNAFERSPASFKDGDQLIPENTNGVPDILDEVRWEIQFFLNMQIPAGKPQEGVVYLKLHDLKWGGVPEKLPSYSRVERYVYVPSTAATLNMAATASQASRLWQKYDADFARRCLDAARIAWKAALANPNLLAGHIPGSGGGDYGDETMSDEFFWAAAELYITTGDQEYLDHLQGSPWWNSNFGTNPKSNSAMGWPDTSLLGVISLITAKNNLPAAELARFKNVITETADRYLAIQQADGYLVPLTPEGYDWGSNSMALNNGIMMALAADLTGKAAYRAGAVQSMDYVLGHNGLKKSYVSGYGVNAALYPHHRLWVDAPSLGYPPLPPGVIVGGPNKKIQDNAMIKNDLDKVAISKRYVDSRDSYATNEVAINWNAPLAWLAIWLDREGNK
jgi:endoglucanase